MREGKGGYLFTHLINKAAELCKELGVCLCFAVW